jgi:hypothetical protein
MAYLVKVTGVANGLVFYAEKYNGQPQGAGGTVHRSAAQLFGYGQALEVATLIQKTVGKRATAEIEPA